MSKTREPIGADIPLTGGKYRSISSEGLTIPKAGKGFAAFMKLILFGPLALTYRVIIGGALASLEAATKKWDPRLRDYYSPFESINHSFNKFCSSVGNGVVGPIGDAVQGSCQDFCDAFHKLSPEYHQKLFYERLEASLHNIDNIPSAYPSHASANLVGNQIAPQLIYAV